MARDRTWLRKLAEAYFDTSLHLDLPLDDDDPEVLDDKDDREGAIMAQVYYLPIFEPESCWDFIQIACEMPLNKDQLDVLGAGVFEDLMGSHGEQFIERVEAAAKMLRNVQSVIDAVWVTSMKPDIALRIEKLKSKAVGA